MRNNILQPIFYVCSTAFSLVGCASKTLPNVNNAIYQSYDNSGERGYHISFEVSTGSIPATAVVINKIKQRIVSENKMGLVYKIDVIAQSRKLFGFKPIIIDRENGIFFKTDTTEVFKKIDFKLKTE